MRVLSRALGRTSAVLLILIMMVGLMWTTPLATSAATVDAEEKSHDIAIVFDNSGSMYESPAWCRAKYAMEIFASMINYGKDSLHIFPMWEVTTDGSRPESGGSFSAIEIKSKADIDKISNMYTVKAWGTPFAPVTEAGDYLSRSKADEKWLIVLTDGEFNQVGRNSEMAGFTDNELKNRLLGVAKNGIKVQYVGFAGASELSSDEGRNFFAKKSSDTSLKKDLIDICNAIFQRSELPRKYLTNAALNLDLSMKSVIVFVQGSNANIASLTDSGGQKIAVTMDSGQRKYSKISAGAPYKDAPVDDTLAGQVVTFAACPKGQYTLSYSGVDQDNIQIFYEPDVDIQVTLKNSDGVEITETDTLASGKYTITSRLIDRVTGEDVTSHELMGNDVTLTTYVKTSQNAQPTEYPNGAEIEFNPGDEVSIYIRGRYLEKYTISSEDDPGLNWLNGLDIQPPPVPLQVEATVLQDHSWYTQSDHDNWQPIRVDLTIDGQPLTADQMANTELSVTVSPELKVRYEMLPGESAYMIYIAQDQNGAFVEPDNGNYTLTAHVTYTDEYGQPIQNEDSVKFDIQSCPWWWPWLWKVLLGLLALAILAAILFHPVLPKKIILVSDKDGEDPIYIKRGQPVEFNYCLNPSAQPLSGKPRIIRKSNNMWIIAKCNPTKQSFMLESPSSIKVSKFSFNGQDYSISKDGSLCKKDSKELVTSLKISSDIPIGWAEEKLKSPSSGSKLYFYSAKIKINRNV